MKLYNHRFDIVPLGEMTGKVDRQVMAEAVQEKKGEWRLAGSEVTGDGLLLFWEQEVELERAEGPGMVEGLGFTD